MYDYFVNGTDVGVPDLDKTAGEKYQSMSRVLFDIYNFPNAYGKFPEVPNLFDLNGDLLSNISIIQKGKAFYLIDRGSKGGKYIETMKPFSDKQIIFSFSIYDFPKIEEIDFESEPNACKEEDVVNTYVFDILAQTY